MDIFDFAMKTEIEGISFYKQLSLSADNKGLKTIFNWLAEEEEKHYEVFKKMKTDETASYQASLILNKVKTLFEEISESNDILDVNNNQVDLYKKAQDLEQKTKSFYESKAQEVTNQKQKETLLEIAKEEGRHYFLMESIINFVSRPKEWVENSEFNHLEDYYE